MQHDAIRRSVAQGTKRRPLKFTAGNEASGAYLSDNLAVVVHDLAYCEVKIAFGIIPWMPLVPSTIWVT
jgi:hypothetical protein